ncbi:hypothetical protein [Collinsella sp. AF28-5AC]|uniref:hypothetical protein n=1 Tax=Collinsella sp. AF28-5AC TaxID=2292227 RepID=UPI000E4F343B|nr:hypothetical protein [Collinsella sp. AF28-5AC]RGQ34816.1 hypothetical protein DWZ01_01775 [Collinsella sp. AF28-5AC]
MDDLTNVNREMAAALRALALAGPRPVSEYVNVPAALSKLGIECHHAEGELLIDRRDALTLADYIDRPVGDSGFARQIRRDIAMSLRYAVSDAVFEEISDGDTLGRRGLLDLCDLAKALDLDVKYYNEEYPAVEQCAARDLADKIDVQTCRYVRERVGVWICDKCGHDEGKYGAHSYRHCPICGRVIEKTVGK